MKKIPVLIIGFFIASLFLYSCKREGCTDEKAANYDSNAKTDDGSCFFDDENIEEDTQSTEDNNKTQNEFDDVLSIIEDAMNKFKNDMDKSSMGDTTCAILTLDTVYNENGSKGRIIIDFGEVNCKGNDDKERRGKILVAYNGKYNTIGTKIITTFDNFFVNDNQIEGTKVVERISQTEFNINVSNAKITWKDGKTTTWQSNRTRIWTEGVSTPFNLSDDVYTINGTASGTNRNNLAFTATISDVIVKIECWFSLIFQPSSGIITVSPEGLKDRVLDYGDGNCDRKGTIKIGDNEPKEYDLDK